MARPTVSRITFDLTPAQRQAVNTMRQQYEKEIAQRLGLDVHITEREFFHALLKMHANDTAQPWPEDYEPRIHPMLTYIRAHGYSADLLDDGTIRISLSKRAVTTSEIEMECHLKREILSAKDGMVIVKL